MPEKFDEYTDVLTRLVKETIACTPAEWTTGTLTIDCDGTRIDYKLKNESQPGKASISESLAVLCEELYVCMRNRGEVWIRATLIIHVDGNDAKFSTSFDYAH